MFCNRVHFSEFSIFGSKWEIPALIKTFEPKWIVHISIPCFMVHIFMYEVIASFPLFEANRQILENFQRLSSVC